MGVASVVAAAVGDDVAMVRLPQVNREARRRDRFRNTTKKGLKNRKNIRNNRSVLRVHKHRSRVRLPGNATSVTGRVVVAAVADAVTVAIASGEIGIVVPLRV